MSNQPNENERYDTGFVVDGDTRLDEPKMYRVILHNDHYTTMDFVVAILMKIFHKSAAEATKIMLDVHKQGQGLCGVYTCDIAMTKVSQVNRMAKEHEFPLKCSSEEA
jgi:ATP-dependent Clp protease adaptor protein ClpS